MSIVIGAIADDYTGASDLANTFSKAGLRTIQTIGVPAGDLALPPADAVVVALKSRSIAAADAVSQSRSARDWLKAHGAEHILFKICSTFDSTDAGNIGPVTDALREDAGGGMVLITPAFPEVGRTVYLGHLFVGTLPLAESPLKDHPLNPMRDSDLVRVLGRQSRHSVGLVDLQTVARGTDAIRARLEGLARLGVGSAIIDAVFDADLETIGKVAIRHPISTGASGLGLGLARALVSEGRVVPHAADAAAGGNLAPGHAAILAGSCSRATLEQLETIEMHSPIMRINVETIAENPEDEIARCIDWAKARIGDGPVVIASSNSPDAIAALQEKIGREKAGHAIEAGIASIAERLVAAGVNRLVVAGGETSGAVTDRLGIPAFAIGPEIAPGVPLLHTIGARTDMRLALKSGNFGGPDFFREALAAMG